MRNAKAFGLALVAAMALGAVAASAASATYDSHSESTVLEGTQVGVNEFHTGLGTVKCKTATFEGTQSGGKEVEEGVWTTDSITVHPEYTKCTAFGLSATVNTEGCNYVFSEATTTGENKSHSEVHIECDPGKAIVITNFGGCTVTVPEQTPTEGLVDFENQNVENTSERDVLVTSTVKGIHYTRGGSCADEGVTHTDGEYTGEVTVKGFDTKGEPTGIWVT